MKIVEPVSVRDPFFDGWDTQNVKHSFDCSSCGAMGNVDFKHILSAAWNWREKTEVAVKLKLSSLFDIELENKFIGNGMDAVVATKCLNCGNITYTYFWLHEYRHSCYQISFRGSAHSPRRAQ